MPAAAVIRGPLVFDHVTRCTRPQRRLTEDVFNKILRLTRRLIL